MKLRLTILRLTILRVLARAERIGQSSMTATELMEASKASDFTALRSALSHLENHELVDRTKHHPQRGRPVRITLTTKGRDTFRVAVGE